MFDRTKFFDESLNESAETKLAILKHCREDVYKAIDIMNDSIKAGGKILFCGNGGSAADSQHLATEFIIRLSHDIKRPAIGAIALTTDSSLLTAGANDIGAYGNSSRSFWFGNNDLKRFEERSARDEMGVMSETGKFSKEIYNEGMNILDNIRDYKKLYYDVHAIDHKDK